MLTHLEHAPSAAQDCATSASAPSPLGSEAITADDVPCVTPRRLPQAGNTDDDRVAEHAPPGPTRRWAGDEEETRQRETLEARRLAAWLDVETRILPKKDLRARPQGMSCPLRWRFLLRTHAQHATKRERKKKHVLQKEVEPLARKSSVRGPTADAAANSLNAQCSILDLPEKIIIRVVGINEFFYFFKC